MCQRGISVSNSIVSQKTQLLFQSKLWLLISLTVNFPFLFHNCLRWLHPHCHACKYIPNRGTFFYRFWKPGEPNLLFAEKCAAIHVKGNRDPNTYSNWNNVLCFTSCYRICELPVKSVWGRKFHFCWRSWRSIFEKGQLTKYLMKSWPELTQMLHLAMQIWQTSVPRLCPCVSFQDGDQSWMKMLRLMSRTYCAPFHGPPSQMSALILQYFPWLLVQSVSQWCGKGHLCSMDGYWSYKSLEQNLKEEHAVEHAWPTPEVITYSWFIFNVSFFLQQVLCW